MGYATLVFGRIKYEVCEFVVGEQTLRLDKQRAEEHYQYHVVDPAKRARQAYTRALEKQRQTRLAFIKAARIREFVEIRRATGGLIGPRQPAVHVDEVTIDGETHQVEAGTGAWFVQTEADRRYPDPAEPTARPEPDFDQWYASHTKEVRAWKAEFVTSDGAQSVELDEDYDRQWGYPIPAALRELDRLEREGWKIVHVSEDHGVYQGADANDEAYLTRVRYLLSK